MGRLHEAGERADLAAQIAIERGIVAELGIRAEAQKAGRRGLAVEVEEEHAPAAQGQVLGQMHGHRGLGGPALEVAEGHHLELVAGAPAGAEAWIAGAGQKGPAQLVHGLETEQKAAGAGGLALRQARILLEPAAQLGLGQPKKMGHLAQGQRAQGLPAGRPVVDLEDALLHGLGEVGIVREQRHEVLRFAHRAAFAVVAG